MREIIFDTETTGFDPHNGDRMVEIGCIEMIDKVTTGATYHCYYNPQRNMPAQAEEVHGLSDNFLSDKPLFADKAQELLDFIQDSNLIAHNASFDFGFINAELVKCEMDAISMERMVDTLAIAKKLHPGAKLSLDALCSRYGIDRSHRVKHGALLDAELLAQLYVELCGGRQIGLSLAEDSKAQGVSFNNGSQPILPNGDAKPFRQPRQFQISDAERQQHDIFMATINDPLWQSR